MGNIKDQESNNGNKKIHWVSIVVILSACVFSSAVIYFSGQPPNVFAASHAAVLPAAQQIYSIDHSSLLSADIESAANPSPAAVAAYESPPQ